MSKNRTLSTINRNGQQSRKEGGGGKINFVQVSGTSQMSSGSGRDGDSKGERVRDRLSESVRDRLSKSVRVKDQVGLVEMEI